MRYYPRTEIEQLRKRGIVTSERDRNDNMIDILTVTLPEPGGAKVREQVRAIEDATISEYVCHPNNPYLRAKFGSPKRAI